MGSNQKCVWAKKLKKKHSMKEQNFMRNMIWALFFITKNLKLVQKSLYRNVPCNFVYVSNSNFTIFQKTFFFFQLLLNRQQRFNPETRAFLRLMFTIFFSYSSPDSSHTL